MKNKKMTLILVATVSVVWSLIFYQVFHATTDTPRPLNTSTAGMLPTADFTTLVDTFSLDLNYRDPFLGTPAVQETTVARANQIGSTAVEMSTEGGSRDWNFIQYKGYILNPASRKKVSIVAVNGREQMLGEGNEVDGVKLLRNFGDSVKISFQGQTKFIQLK